jgi:acyl carrier protein
MKTVTEQGVRDFLLNLYRAPLARKGLKPQDVPEDFDLLRESVIDSLGILEMLEALEAEYGVPINFDGMDNDQATRVGPLARHVAETAGKVTA